LADTKDERRIDPYRLDDDKDSASFYRRHSWRQQRRQFKNFSGPVNSNVNIAVCHNCQAGTTTELIDIELREKKD
jgi:hypothetical protein